MNRPVGVVLVSGFVGFTGVVGAFASLLIPSALGPILAVLSLLLVSGAYGLYQSKAWGWLLVSALYAVGIVFNLAIGGISDGQDLFRLALSAVILAYLYRRRDYFLADGRSGKTPNGEYEGRRD